MERVQFPVQVIVLVLVTPNGATPVLALALAPTRSIMGAGIVGYLSLVVASLRCAYSTLIFVTSAPVGRLNWKFVTVTVEGLGRVPPFLDIVFVSAYPLAPLRVTRLLNFALLESAVCEYVLQYFVMLGNFFHLFLCFFFLFFLFFMYWYNEPVWCGRILSYWIVYKCHLYL